MPDASSATRNAVSVSNSASSARITETAPLAASRLSCLIAYTVLAGWFFQLDFLTYLVPGVIAMNPVTAIGLLAASISLSLLFRQNVKKRHKLIGLSIAAFVLVLGALYFLRSTLNSDVIIPVWQPGLRIPEGSLVESNGPRIALSFVLVGLSLLLLNIRTSTGRRPATLTSAATVVIAILSLIAYSHSLVPYYTTPAYVPASLLTSICFLVLATGILLARADHGILAIVVSGTAGGVLARRLIPLAILLPILIGALRQAGQNAGLYGVAFGAAHSATAFMLVFFAAIWWIARMLFHIDTNRMLAEKERQEKEAHVRQLNIEKIAAEKASKAKDDFLAVLSHELRTPLTPALAAASYLAENEELSPEVREQVGSIRANVQLEARLIDDLLDLTRASRGKIELHSEVIDAHSLLRNSLRIAQDDIAQKQIDLTVDLNAPNQYVWADSVRLQQVFWNLISNAVKFTTTYGRVALRTWNENGRFSLQISNTGVGIEPEQQGRIFDAFEQGERTVSRRFGGLGLGLSISKKLLDLHHGTISVHSSGKNHGASFRVTLGSVEEPQNVLARPAFTSTTANTLQLLVVDDHAQTLRVLSGLLRKLGHKVFTAECVQAALKLLEAERFDALISDIGLPDGNGCELMRAARRKQSLIGIAVSGFGTEEDVRRSIDAGFKHHLTKPIDFQNLKKFVGAIAPQPHLST